MHDDCMHENCVHLFLKLVYVQGKSKSFHIFQTLKFKENITFDFTPTLHDFT